MKFVAVCALLASSASAFTPPSMTFAVGKKAAPVAKKPVGTQAVKAAPKPAAKPVVKAVVKKAAPAPVVKKAAPVVKKAAPVVAKKAAPVVKKAAPVVKKAAPKPAPVIKKVAPKLKSRSSSGTVASTAIPYELAPATLDGSLVGDFGFDPCFLTSKGDIIENYFNNQIFQGATNLDGLSWYREAELMHGRICMAATLGFIAPGFGTISGDEWTGVDAFSYTNPLEAFSKVPSLSLFQILAFMSFLEFRRIKFITEAGANYVPGQAQKWGQGEGFWNPFGLNYTPEEYKEKQLQEIKNGRLAMVGFLGVLFQSYASGEGVVEQLSAALSSPEYYAKAGYYFPAGI